MITSHIVRYRRWLDTWDWVKALLTVLFTLASLALVTRLW